MQRFILPGVILILVLGSAALAKGDDSVCSTFGTNCPEVANEDMLEDPDFSGLRLKGSSKLFSGRVRGGVHRGLVLKGKREGTWIQSYETGEVHQVYTYKSGRLVGPLTNFHKNGNMSASATIAKCPSGQHLLNERFTKYHWDGAIEEEGTYKDCVKHGLWTNYDENGYMTKQVTYENGIEVP